MPLARPGVGAGDEHLEGDQAVESEVPGLVDDAHAPVAEERLYVIARDPRQVAVQSAEQASDRHLATSSEHRKERIELRFDGAHLPPAAADFRQQLGAVAADLLRAAPGVGDLVKFFAISDSTP